MNSRCYAAVIQALQVPHNGGHFSRNVSPTNSESQGSKFVSVINPIAQSWAYSSPHSASPVVPVVVVVVVDAVVVVVVRQASSASTTKWIDPPSNRVAAGSFVLLTRHSCLLSTNEIAPHPDVTLQSCAHASSDVILLARAMTLLSFAR